MEKTGKFPTCCCQIRHDGFFFKGHESRFYEKGIDCTQVSRPSNWKEVDLCYEYGLEEIFPFKLYSDFKTWKLLMIFRLNIVWPDFHSCGTRFRYQNCSTLMQNCLQTTEMDMSTLGRACQLNMLNIHSKKQEPPLLKIRPLSPNRKRPSSQAYNYLQRHPCGLGVSHRRLCCVGIQRCIEMDQMWSFKTRYYLNWVRMCVDHALCAKCYVLST